jgi:hypothetical protein
VWGARLMGALLVGEGHNIYTNLTRINKNDKYDDFKMKNLKKCCPCEHADIENIKRGMKNLIS